MDVAVWTWEQIIDIIICLYIMSMEQMDVINKL